MPPAIAAAGIAAAGTIGGALLGSSSQKKAASQAADAQADSTAAQLELGRESLALQEQMFNQGMGFNALQAGTNYDILSPFVGSGLGATNALNALLGITPVAMPANPYASADGPAPATPAPAGGGGGTNALAPSPGLAPHVSPHGLIGGTYINLP